MHAQRTTESETNHNRPNEKTIVNEIEHHVPYAPYRHLIWFAMAYGLILAVCAAAASFSLEWFIYSPLVTISLATIILVAVWSVFGPGSYLRRLFWAHLIGLIVAVETGIGYLLFKIVFAETGFVDSDWAAFRFAYWLVVLPTVSLAAQLPFWFFRVFFGWQFVYGDRPPRQSYALRDLFIVTFLFALSFAGPQLAVNLHKILIDSFDPNVEWVETTQSDGSVVFERKNLTDKEAIAELKRRHDSELRGAFRSFKAAAINLFVITLITFPVLLFVFLMNETRNGCIATVVYGLGLLCCCLLLIAVLSGFSGLGEGMLFIGLPIACCVGALAIPLAVSRATGFRLTSAKRYAKDQAKLESQNMAEISAVAAD